MEQQQKVIKRLQRIFDVFLQESFASTNNVYFEKLITHLAEKGKCNVNKPTRNHHRIDIN